LRNRFAHARDIVYRDLFMPSRMSEYRRLVGTLVDGGYTIMPIERMWATIRADDLDPSGRYAVIRHDIDTDPKTAALMWRIEQEAGVQTSWYYRWSTLDIDTMREIDGAGGEASYHYEEVATVAKRYRIRDHQRAVEMLPEARDLFLRNLDRLRAMTGLPMRVVASHGDFVNRKLRLPNTEILADPAFRARAGVDLETYDDAFMRHVTARHSDDMPPESWQPSDALEAIRSGSKVVYLLVHPRNWRADRRVNARDDVRRVRDGISYALPVGHAHAPAEQVSTPPRPADAGGIPPAPSRLAEGTVIHPGVVLGDGGVVEPYVILGVPRGGRSSGDDPLLIGSGARIRSHTVIYAGTEIGKDFQSGHGVLIREATRIGDNVSIGSHTVIEHHVTLKDGVRVHSNAFIPEFSVIEEGAWVGPNAVFTNARYPLSPSAKDELAGPRVQASAKIGANVTLLPGVVIGRNALVGAGSVVTRDVADGDIVVGNPAHVVGSINDVPAYAGPSAPGPTTARSHRADPAG